MEDLEPCPYIIGLSCNHVQDCHTGGASAWCVMNGIRMIISNQEAHMNYIRKEAIALAIVELFDAGYFAEGQYHKSANNVRDEIWDKLVKECGWEAGEKTDKGLIKLEE